MAIGIEDGAKAIVSAIVVIAVASAILSGVLSGGPAAIQTPANNTTITVDQGQTSVPSWVDVSATRGNAVAFSAWNGYVETPTLGNGSITVCSAGKLASDANTKATYTLYADDNATTLLQYDAGHWMFYHANVSGSLSAKATVAAPNPSATLRPVCGRYNAANETVSVSRGTTVSAPVQMDSDTERRNTSYDWYGSIDETRTFGEAIPNATLTAYGNDPIQPLEDWNRTGRLMYDEGSGTTTNIYWSSQDATIVNGTWTDGLDDVALDKGDDYRLYDRPFQILFPPSGYLDGAPVVYLTWLATPMGINFVSLLMSLVGILIVGIGAVVVLRVFNNEGF